MILSDVAFSFSAYWVFVMSAAEYRSVLDENGKPCMLSSGCMASAGVPVAFDCDGVLVDTSGSYDVAIAKTVETLLGMRYGRHQSFGNAAGRMIFQLRKTGAFNNDWDSTFAIMLFTSLALLEEENGSAEERDIAGRTEELVGMFTSKPVTDACRDVVAYVGEIAGGPMATYVTRLVEWLSYPGSPPESLLATVFDELYYGEEGFAEFYGRPARYHSGEGLSGTEKLLFDRDLIEDLTRLSGRKPAIITGRPAKGTRITLGKLLDLFDLDSSVFIGDGDADPKSRSSAEASELRKPGPGALLKCMKSMRCGSLIYVGNSAEDLQMSVAARKLGYTVWFAGVCGQGPDAQPALDYFRSEGADMIMQDISQLPYVLRRADSHGR